MDSNINNIGINNIRINNKLDIISQDTYDNNNDTYDNNTYDNDTYDNNSDVSQEEIPPLMLTSVNRIKSPILDFNENSRLIRRIRNNTSRDDFLINKQLMESLNELNTIQAHLLDCVNSGDEKIDTIENNIISSQSIVEQGKDELVEAKKYYFTYTPILVGTLLGAGALSPMALLLNIKLSGLFSLGGGVLGGYAGYKIQK